VAIWQVYCNIVPIRDNMTQLTQDQIISWKGISNSLPEINFLKSEESWSEDIIQYGKIDETCIEFIYDEVLEEIACRFDLRNLTKMELDSIIEYVQKNNAVFFAEDHLFMSERNELLEFFKQSEAFNFCTNPSEFIKSLV